MLALVATLSIACLTASSALAQTAAQKAAAQALFEEASKLKKDGMLAEACPKFAQSYELEPTIGTMLNLARCYEDLGKLASAYVSYEQVAAEAKMAGQKDRSEYAAGRAKALKSRLASLTIEVAELVEGMKVMRGDEEIVKAVFGVAVPIDAGDHEVRVTAPGKKPWSKVIKIADGPESSVLKIPALEDAPVAVDPGAPPPVAAKPPAEDEVAEGSSLALPVTGWVAVAVGLGGVGAGVALRVIALQKDDESLEHCDPNDVTFCTDDGVALRDEAATFQLGSLIAFIAGGAIAGAGVALVIADFMSDDGSEEGATALRVAPVAGPQLAGLSISGRF